MNIFRITILSLPLVAFSSTAFAQSTDSADDIYKDSADKVNKGADKTKKTVDDTSKKTNKAVDDTSKKAKDTTNKAVDSTKKTTKDVTDDVTTTTTDTKETVTESVGTATTTSAAPPVRDTAEVGPLTLPKRTDASNKWSAEPLFGYGTNDFNAGVGARAGYTFNVPVYVGATFMWHFGETNNSIGPNAVTETKETFYYPGIEVGYDFAFGNLLLRPYGGTAILFDRERVTINNVSVSNTDSALMLYPGVTGRYTLPRTPVYVGADSRVLIPLENKGASFQVFGVAGVSM